MSPEATVEAAPVAEVAPEAAAEAAPVAEVALEVVAEAAPEVVAEETPAQVEVEAPEASEPEMSFEQALEEFEAGEGGVRTTEEMLKRKADRRKRQTLEYDEELGKVVAKRKRKAGRARDEWDA